MQHINEQQLSEILQPSITEMEWESRLGEAVNEALAGKVDHFDFDAQKFGDQMWKGFRLDLFEFFCEGTRPREWLNDLLTGDIRNTILGVVTAITTRYDIALGIAIPISALIFKTGIVQYCSRKQEDSIDDPLFLAYLEEIRIRSSQKTKRGKKGRKKRKG